MHLLYSVWDATKDRQAVLALADAALEEERKRLKEEGI